MMREPQMNGSQKMHLVPAMQHKERATEESATATKPARLRQYAPRCRELEKGKKHALGRHRGMVREVRMGESRQASGADGTYRNPDMGQWCKNVHKDNAAERLRLPPVSYWQDRQANMTLIS